MKNAKVRVNGTRAKSFAEGHFENGPSQKCPDPIQDRCASPMTLVVAIDAF
jgi:hypothetical protein